jgi:hypothetical protein
MTALLLVLVLFAGWSLVGVAALAAAGADTSELRTVLVAPMLGTCVTLLTIFVFSEAGVAIRDSAVPVAIFLAVASLAIVGTQRPPVHRAVIAVALVCVGGLLLEAWPLFTYGFDWLANGNEDMTNYVLSAEDLLKHGLTAPIDFRGLAQGRDYATVLSGLHLVGGRPGGDIVLAFVSRIAGRPPYQMFMPVILALNLCGACAVGALAMQFARRWWAGLLAVGLVLVSPLATYGVLQELLGQVIGLGMAVALLALLMRPELHTGRGPRIRELIPIGLFAAGLALGYIELVPTMGIAYLIYVGVLGLRRRLSVRALARLWLPSLAIVLIVLNAYLFTELGFLKHQTAGGLKHAVGPPLFGYILVPSGLPGVVGLQTLPPGAGARLLDVTIALAALMLLGALIAALISVRRGIGAAAVLVVEAALGLVLAVRSNDFGLFKLSMYIQPFLAATVAIWLSEASRKRLQIGAAVLLALLVAAELGGQRAYVKASRNPQNAPNLSAVDVIPAFHRLMVTNPGPVVSVTENPVLIKLEAASADERPLYFQSRDGFKYLLGEYAKEVGGVKGREAERAIHSPSWITRSFKLLNGKGEVDPFQEDANAERALRTDRCELVLAGDNEVPFNRRSLPVFSPNLVSMSCDAPHDLLSFTSSELGESFYLPESRRDVSFFQQQDDPYFAGTMAGFGRYALFRVLGPSPGARLELEFTDTLNHDGENLLPPAAVVGASRLSLPLEGRGSARVFSPPLKPQMVDGSPYVLIDMGVNGRLPTVIRTGLENAYGKSVPTDPRYLTGYLRDISLVSGAQYASLHPPLALSHFPGDLDNTNLEYSGIYEDGWMAQEGYVRLAGGPPASLLVQGEVPAGAGKHLELLVNGRRVDSLAIAAGRLDVRTPIPASETTRRVELRFAATIKLKAPDERPASVLLSFLGVVPTTRVG